METARDLLVEKMKNPDPQLITAVTFLHILLDIVRGGKHLLFNRYRELFFSCIVEVTPIVRKKFQRIAVAQLQSLIGELRSCKLGSMARKNYKTHVSKALENT